MKCAMPLQVQNLSINFFQAHLIHSISQLTTSPLPWLGISWILLASCLCIRLLCNHCKALHDSGERLWKICFVLTFLNPHLELMASWLSNCVYVIHVIRCARDRLKGGKYIDICIWQNFTSYFCGLRFNIVCFIFMTATAVLRSHYKFSLSLFLCVYVVGYSMIQFSIMAIWKEGQYARGQLNSSIIPSSECGINQICIKLLTIVKRGDFASQSSKVWVRCQRDG